MVSSSHEIVTMLTPKNVLTHGLLKEDIWKQPKLEERWKWKGP